MNGKAYLVVLLVLVEITGHAKGQSGAQDAVYALAQLGIARNAEIGAARERVTEARGLLRQAGVRPAPTIEATGLNGRPFGSAGEAEYSASYFHPIETAGKRDKRVRVAEKSVELAEAEVGERTRLLAFDIKGRYVDALAQRQKLEIIDRLLAVNRESLRLTRARADAGDIPPLDYQLLQVDVSRLDAQRIAAAGRASAALVELRSLLGPDESVAVSGELTLHNEPPAMEELLKRAAARPDLRMAQILEEQSTAEIAMAEAQSRPDITLSAGYSHSSAQFEDPIRRSAGGAPLALRDRDNLLRFGISVPLFSRERNRGAVEAAGARASAARMRRQQLESTIRLEVEAAWQRWRAASQAFSMFESGVIGQSEKNLELIRQGYDLGELRILDVLNEQRRLIDNQMAYIDAKAEAARAYYELERAVGADLK